MKKKSEPHREQQIRIALPEKHWVVLLTLIDQFINKSVKPEVERIRKEGIKLEDIDDAQTAVLAGPIMIRGIIIKELAARGIVKPELMWRAGIDKIMAGVEEFQKGLKDGKSKPKDE